MFHENQHLLAGLVRGASEGAGLGNQFLANIRQVSVILHLLRCFDDNENNMITHVDGSVDPVRDLETIETEVFSHFNFLPNSDLRRGLR